MATLPRYMRTLNFESAGITRQQILALEITPEQDSRAEELVTKEKEAGLTSDEEHELDFYEQQHRFLLVMKAQALEMIQSSEP